MDHANAAPRKAHRTERVEGRATALLEDCNTAFRSFLGLDELAENLRILSLNAELAAGRAGERGRAVRALTQYTRELVNRLSQIRGEMSQMRRKTEALTTKISECLASMQANGEESGASSRSRQLKPLLEDVAALISIVEDLARRAHAVEEVVNQSDSIATNIAIEAAAAGVHEKEFRTVSDTMRIYVDDLRKMIEGASDAVRSALERGAVLARL